MTIFNIIVGGAFGLVAISSLLIIKQKWAKQAIIFAGIFIAWGGYEFSKVTFYPHYLGWEFESQIKKQPLFALIASTHPAEFQQFLNQAKVALKEKEDSEAVSTYSATLVNAVFSQHLQHTPNENIMLYLKATMDLYRHLNAINPQAIVSLEKGDQSQLESLNQLFANKEFEALLSHVLDTKRYAIEAGIQTPVLEQKDKEAKELIKEIFKRLVVQFGESEVRLAFSNQLTTEDNKSPQVIIQFYTELLNTGQENAGIIIRHMAAQKFKLADKG